jgi:DNA polymerase-3 subunit alpha
MPMTFRRPRIGKRGERLANEKEVLGFFVSGHPMDKYAEKLRNLTRVITTSEALERKPPERTWGKQLDPADEIQVAGMIVGLRVQKSKRDQKQYAQAALEDTTGKIDLICFSRDYERLQGQLKIEAPVLVRGVLMGDDDAAPKISVSSVMALEDVQVKLPAGVRIRLNLDRVTEEMFVELKERRRRRAGAWQSHAASGKEGRVRGDSGARGHERGRGSHLGRACRRTGRQRNGAGGGVEPSK